MKFIKKIAEALKYTFADKKTVDEMPDTIMEDIVNELSKEYLIQYQGPVQGCQYFIISEYGVQDQDVIKQNNGFYAKYGETIAYVFQEYDVGISSDIAYDMLQTILINSDIINNGLLIGYYKNDIVEDTR